MTEWARDFKTILQLVRPRKSTDHASQMEAFYKDQADDYDHFRNKLLPAREELFKMIEKWNPGPVWVDIGAGTGFNLECIDLKFFNEIYLVDLSSALLEIARKRKEKLTDKFTDKKIHLVHQDINDFDLQQKVDLITFSYSLTMIPDWFSAIDKAIKLLKPGGILAVADFHIPTQEPDNTTQVQKFFANCFWPSWFSWDGVHFSRDHVKYLKTHFDVVFYEQDVHELPYLPFSQVPYYLLIGRKK